MHSRKEILRSQLRHNVLAQHNPEVYNNTVLQQYDSKPRPPSCRSDDLDLKPHRGRRISISTEESAAAAVPEWARSSVDTYCTTYQTTHDSPRSAMDYVAEVDDTERAPSASSSQQWSCSRPQSPQAAAFVHTLRHRQQQFLEQARRAEHRLMQMLAGSTLSLDPASMEQVNGEVNHWRALEQQVALALKMQQERPEPSPPAEPSPPTAASDAEDAAHELQWEEDHVLFEVGTVRRSGTHSTAQHRRGSEASAGSSDCEETAFDEPSTQCRAACSRSRPNQYDESDFENVSKQGDFEQGDFEPIEYCERDFECVGYRRSSSRGAAHVDHEGDSRSVARSHNSYQSHTAPNAAQLAARGRVKQVRAVQQAYLVPGRQYAHLPNLRAAGHIKHVSHINHLHAGASRRPPGLYDPEPIEDLEARVIERLKKNEVSLANRNFSGGVRSANGWNKFLT